MVGAEFQRAWVVLNPRHSHLVFWRPRQEEQCGVEAALSSRSAWATKLRLAQIKHNFLQIRQENDQRPLETGDP